MQVVVGGCLPMCLCVWNNLSMERDKGLHQGVQIMGGLGRVLVGGTEILQQMKSSSPELLN